MREADTVARRDDWTRERDDQLDTMTVPELVDLIVDASLYAAVAAVDTLLELPRDASQAERREAIERRRSAVRAMVGEQLQEDAGRRADEAERNRPKSRAELRDERARRRWGVD